MDKKISAYFGSHVTSETRARLGIVQEVVRNFHDTEKVSNGNYFRLSKLAIAGHLCQHPLTKQFFVGDSLNRVARFIGDLIHFGYLPELVIDSYGTNRRDRYPTGQAVKPPAAIKVAEQSFTKLQKESLKIRQEYEALYGKWMSSKAA